MFEGAFSLAIMDRDTLVGVRDPHGFRPLCLGRFNDDAWVIASETAALDIIGANVRPRRRAGRDGRHR